jgi:uncharacterized protein DUF4231
MAADAPAYPAYVSHQLEFYQRTSRGARVGYIVSETVALVAAAAVPVSAATGAARWVPAVLGAIAAITTGLRQVFEYRQNWILRTVAQEAIKARVAAYEAREQPAATRRLVHDVAGIALAETDRWRQLGEQAVPTPMPTQAKDE